MSREQTFYDMPSYGGVCPKCGTRGCQQITETKYRDGGYGIFSGICGYLILGPIGLLCGLCGHSDKYRTKSYWVCPNCGKRFKL